MPKPFCPLARRWGTFKPLADFSDWACTNTHYRGLYASFGGIIADLGKTNFGLPRRRKRTAQKVRPSARSEQVASLEKKNKKEKKRKKKEKERKRRKKNESEVAASAQGTVAVVVSGILLFMERERERERER